MKPQKHNPVRRGLVRPLCGLCVNGRGRVISLTQGNVGTLTVTQVNQHFIVFYYVRLAFCIKELI